MEEDQILTEKQRKLIEVCWIIRLFGWLAFGVSLVVAGWAVFPVAGSIFYKTSGLPAGSLLQNLAAAGSNILMGLMAVGLSQLVPYLFGLFTRPPRLARLFPLFAFAKAGFVALSAATQIYVHLHLLDNDPSLRNTQYFVGLAQVIGWKIGEGFVNVVFFIGLGLLVKYSLPLLDDARAMV